MISRPGRLLAGGLASLALAGGLLATTPTASAAGPGETEEYFMTPGTFDWTVPAGVTEVTFEVNGAQGGGGDSGAGALGGQMIAEFAVTPGDTYKLWVGGRGATGGGAGGFNGGGASGDGSGCSIFEGGSGGGASDVRTSGNGLADRLLVAGGGGGAGNGFMGDTAGGVGGGTTPTAGADAMWGADGGEPGGPSAGGASGGGYGSPDPGALGVGGDGGDDGCTTGGGGGGGYYGGGGGDSAPGDPTGGGGGGSAYVDPGANLTAAADGVQSGDGAIVITYATPAPPTTTTTTTTTTVPPATSPPKADCPTPVPGLRVYPNAFSVQVAAHLIDNCGSTAREVQVHSEKLVVLDPPANGTCPTWRAVRVVAERNSVLIAAHLIDNCRYTATMQREGRNGASVWVVPSGWPTGARAFA